ncbi:YeeE/YedE family protein [Pseudomonas putida S11]|nr:YeeE/YedE family protein [Pseudomonas putida S11]
MGRCNCLADVMWTRRLIGGSLVFGIGWGLAGICPGPALVLLPAGYWQAWLFVAAMLVGMGLFQWLEARRGS